MLLYYIISVCNASECLYIYIYCYICYNDKLVHKLINTFIYIYNYIYNNVHRSGILSKVEDLGVELRLNRPNCSAFLKQRLGTKSALIYFIMGILFRKF